MPEENNHTPTTEQYAQLAQLYVHLFRYLPYPEKINSEFGIPISTLSDSISSYLKDPSNNINIENLPCSKNTIFSNKGIIPLDRLDDFMKAYDYAINDYLECHESDDIKRLWAIQKLDAENAIKLIKKISPLFILDSSVGDIEIQRLEVERDLILANMESKFLSLEKKEAYKIYKNFEGYASFKCFPLIHALAIMTDGAKSVLYDEIIRIERTDTLGNELRSMQRRNTLLSQCMDIRDNTYAGNSKIKSTEETWKVFKKKMSKCLEYDLAIVAGLLIFFDIHKFKALDLNIMIAYSFYQNQQQREDFMYLVRKMLVKANIKEPYTLEYLLPSDFYSSSYDIKLLGALSSMLSDYDVNEFGTLLC